MIQKGLLLLFVWCCLTLHIDAQVDARLFRHPDVSDSQITFVYGGDIWIVDKNGGTATKLSSPKGAETFPRFSPDGSSIAFTGNYDGNTDIYTIPITGGIPQRLTYHGMSDRVLDWYPDGSKVLFASSSESGKQRFSQFYNVSAEGGLRDKLPLAYGEFGSLSPDGRQIAFTDRTRVFRTWKRYRGGTAADIWIFNLNTMASENITNNEANDELPMWVGDNIYYLSDDGPAKRFNIWKYDSATKTSNQITFYKDYDVHFPSPGRTEIVYEAQGKMYLLDLATETSKEININVVSDLSTLKPKKEKVSSYIQSAGISPKGNRVVVEARGETYSLPAKKGIVKNLSNTSGAAERYPAWSPSGQYIAYWSDQTGEYELTLRVLSDNNKETTLSNLGPGYRYNLYWSPDSKKLAYIDEKANINIFDIASKEQKVIDRSPSLMHGGMQGWSCSWSKDSKWLTYENYGTNGNAAIMIYDVADDKLTQATSGFYSDSDPVFGADGDYLYLVTQRHFSPAYSSFDNSFVYNNADHLAVIPLRDDVVSPLAAENDTVAFQLEKEETDEEESNDDEDAEEKKDEDENAEEEKLEINFNGFEKRMIILPVEPGRFSNLSAVSGKLIYTHYPNVGSDSNQSKIKFYDLKEREIKTIFDQAGGYELSADGEKILTYVNGQLTVIGTGPNQEAKDMVPTSKMEMMLHPKEEWRQIFNDAWRFERDMFYDKGMHGVDWDAMRTQYGDMIEDAITRDDVNFILGELIGELNASHTYRGGGDQEYAARKAVGYLGVDWKKENGKFKIEKIIRGADWDTEVISPFDEPGIDVQAGDYLIAVNGESMDNYTDPWAPFEGLAEETVELTIEKKDGTEKNVIVKTLSDETRLRNLAWIESNRKRVDEASGGQIGYIYVPSTGYDGQNELVRQFYAQWDKPGLIVDERFNNGGQIPDRFIELLNRKPLAYWKVRNDRNWQWPPVANFGSMAMLINGWSGSGGDAFPDYFRKAGLGPLIGGRTWGGLIGISGAPSLVDGGVVTVPTFRMYDPDGTWFKEGYGVAPDIEVMEDHTQLAKGIDTQLERAIQEVLQSIQSKGPLHPAEPSPERRD